MVKTIYYPICCTRYIGACFYLVPEFSPVSPSPVQCSAISDLPAHPCLADRLTILSLELPGACWRGWSGGRASSSEGPRSGRGARCEPPWGTLAGSRRRRPPSLSRRNSSCTPAHYGVRSARVVGDGGGSALGVRRGSAGRRGLGPRRGRLQAA